MSEDMNLSGNKGDLKSMLTDFIDKAKSNPEIISGIMSLIGNGQIADSGGKDDDGASEETEVFAEGSEETSEIEKGEDEDEEVGEKGRKAPSLDDLSGILNLLMPIMKKDLPVALSKVRNVSDRRTNLLKALRPYLSSERREMVDSILTFAQIGDLFKNRMESGR